MLRFELESDRDVLVDGIGLLPAGKAVEVTEDMVRDFELRNNCKLDEANFPPFVTVTKVSDDPEEALDEEEDIAEEEEAAVVKAEAEAEVVEDVKAEPTE